MKAEHQQFGALSFPRPSSFPLKLSLSFSLSTPPYLSTPYDNSYLCERGLLFVNETLEESRAEQSTESHFAPDGLRFSSQPGTLTPGLPDLAGVLLLGGHDNWGS